MHRPSGQPETLQSEVLPLNYVLSKHNDRPKTNCHMAVVACRVPAYYALILRSLTVLEGLALSADKEYKLLAKAYPYMAQRLLTDPAPELRYDTIPSDECSAHMLRLSSCTSS